MSTICAISTAKGGAIGVIRVSGPLAISATNSIFRSPRGINLMESKPYVLHFGHIVDVDTSACLSECEVVDEVLVTTYRAPHSYTGEDSTEIMCHGSSYILNKVIELLLSQGCRLAQPGEYTQRAFLNGKMDLSQAEAVADLIASNTRASHSIAMKQMRGGISSKLASLRTELLEMTSLLELELDFSEEDVEFADRQRLVELSTDIESEIDRLLESFRAGNAIKNGIPVAIVGHTNAGKSTLLNQLLHEDRAIVSDIHGTTRDAIEDTMTIDGYNFRFIDTAGIRSTDDTIESIGIKKTYEKIEQSDIILLMQDSTQTYSDNKSFSIFPSEYKDIIRTYSDKKIIIVNNKVDMPHAQLLCEISGVIYAGANISAKTGEGINTLIGHLTRAAREITTSDSDILITNLRHVESLRLALNSISTARQALNDRIPSDLIAEDLRQCIFHQADIVGGQITSDEVLGNIFKNFCIGK